MVEIRLSTPNPYWYMRIAYQSYPSFVQILGEMKGRQNFRIYLKFGVFIKIYDGSKTFRGIIFMYYRLAAIISPSICLISKFTTFSTDFDEQMVPQIVSITISGFLLFNLTSMTHYGRRLVGRYKCFENCTINMQIIRTNQLRILNCLSVSI